MTFPFFPYSHCHAELAEASLCTFIPFINEIPQPTNNDLSSGIKAWPENGSGVERGGGLSKRYHMSHAEGVANCIAWQFPHGAPIGSGFSALIFFGSFLYQDKKERVNGSLPCFSFAMQ